MCRETCSNAQFHRLDARGIATKNWRARVPLAHVSLQQLKSFSSFSRLRLLMVFTKQPLQSLQLNSLLEL